MRLWDDSVYLSWIVILVFSQLVFPDNPRFIFFAGFLALTLVLLGVYIKLTNARIELTPSAGQKSASIKVVSAGIRSTTHKQKGTGPRPLEICSSLSSWATVPYHGGPRPASRILYRVSSFPHRAKCTSDGVR